MTIERQYGKIIFLCDVGSSARCEEQIETEESDFDAALLAARCAQWGSAPMDGGGWMHHCGKCQRPRG